MIEAIFSFVFLNSYMINQESFFPWSPGQKGNDIFILKRYQHNKNHML